jgi:hypothetical protein
LAQARDVLTDLLRQGAQQLLAQAIEAEVADWIDRHQDCRDAAGRRQVVRNGHLPERAITTGVGSITVQQPRVLAFDRCQDGPADRRGRRRASRTPAGSGSACANGIGRPSPRMPWLVRQAWQSKRKARPRAGSSTLIRA